MSVFVRMKCTVACCK